MLLRFWLPVHFPIPDGSQCITSKYSSSSGAQVQETLASVVQCGWYIASYFGPRRLGDLVLHQTTEASCEQYGSGFWLGLDWTVVTSGCAHKQLAPKTHKLSFSHFRSFSIIVDISRHRQGRDTKI
eukprot:sb/3475555/